MTFKRTLLAALMAGAAALAACSTATPYQPNVRGQAVSGGFSEVRLADNSWRVTFQGNTLTSRETVETYLLYRAAELSISEGNDWFVMADRQVIREREVVRDPFYDRPGYRYGYWRPYWRYHGPYGWRGWDPYAGDPFWADRMTTETFEQYEASAEIIMGRGPRPEDRPRAFDARQVIADLGPRIQRPQ